MEYHPDPSATHQLLDHLEYVEIKELFGLMSLHIPWVACLEWTQKHDTGFNKDPVRPPILVLK